MDRIGIRELKQNASAVIRRVVAGEALELTDRGRPVARIVPLVAEGALDRMVRDGDTTVPEHDLREFVPLRLARGRRALSETLEEMRANER